MYNFKYFLNIACSSGSFGADCKQTCHCASGSSVCEIDTGRCTSGGCLQGWSGVNCQGMILSYSSLKLM